MVTLVDQFENRNTSVLRPYSLCNPSQRNGSAIKDERAHLLCYQIKDVDGRAFPAQTIALAGALGSDTLKLTRRQTLCVPTTVAPCASVSFTTTAGAASCGGPALSPLPTPPFAGAVYDAATGGSTIADLGAGCIYFGGGDSECYPAAQSVAAAPAPSR